MPLHLRRRGAIWYARGTVRVGRQSVPISEFSTGQTGRDAADAVAQAEARRVAQAITDGPAGRARLATIAEALAAYLGRPGGLAKYDLVKIAAINDLVGDRLITDAAAAWAQLLADNPTWSPATAKRWQNSLRAGLRAGCQALGLSDPPKLPPVRFKPTRREAMLSDDELRRMLAAYNPHAACPVLLLAYAGLRTQEALQLDWSQVSFGRSPPGVLFIRSEKTGGTIRAVPMHPKVDALLFGLWSAAGQPTRGHVFISARGVPYANTKGVGGNPLAQAHSTACARAGIEGFRLHDFRHDFARRLSLAGADASGLMGVLGWSSTRMIPEYILHQQKHMAALVAAVA